MTIWWWEKRDLWIVFFRNSRKKLATRTYIKNSFLENLSELTEKEIMSKTEAFQKYYAGDLYKSFSLECLRYRPYLKTLVIEKKKQCFKSVRLWETVNFKHFFPILISHFGCLFVLLHRTALPKRSPSALKRTKTC